MKYGLGLYKSIFDKRDWLIKSFLKYEGLPIRGGVPNKEMTPIRSQGNEGACVSYALVTGIMEYLNNVIDYPKHKDLISLSTRFLYEASKKISGHKNGTTLKAAVTVGQKLGTCLERYWPYIPNEVNNPHPLAYGNALKFRLKSYARITNIEDLKSALNDPKVKLVLAGVEVFKGMLETKDGIVPNPSCNDRWFGKKGNHGICINYYDDTYAHWKNAGGVDFKNSWSTRWGSEGFGKLSYDYLKNHMVDAFAVMDIDDPNPLRVSDLSDIEKEMAIWL